MKIQKKIFFVIFFLDAKTSNFYFNFLKQLLLAFIWVARFVINNVKIKSIEDIALLKQKLGANAEQYIKKIGLINKNGEREQFVIR